MRAITAVLIALAWPQWGGPNRDFKSSATGIATSWPGGQPKQAWSRALGDGYSAIVEDGGVLYTMYRPPRGVLTTLWEKVTSAPAATPEAVIALDAATGKTLWEHVYDAPWVGAMNMEYGPGPHSTPLIVGDLVYAIGVTGKLHALNKQTGKVAWFHDLYQEFGAKRQDRGYSCSPIAYRQTVICSAGGRGGQALMAFDQKTGAVAWKNYDFDPSPSSPVLIDVDGQDQLVFFDTRGATGVDPAGKAVYWDQPHATDYGLNIAMPVWGEGNLLFLSSAYSGGSRMLHLTQSGGKTAVMELWFTNKLRLHIGNALRLGDRVYASSGDFGPSFVTALDVKTGEVAWQDRGFARATMLYADGKVILLDEDGALGLATITPTGLQVHHKASVLSNKAWTSPTLVGTRLFVRDRASVKAFDLG